MHCKGSTVMLFEWKTILNPVSIMEWQSLLIICQESKIAGSLIFVKFVLTKYAKNLCYDLQKDYTVKI